MKNKLTLNTFLSVLYQFIAIIIGLIIPRLILNAFGSEVNGLVSSITQMLTIVSFLDLGVGSVVQVSLYGPLSSRDNQTISKIYCASQSYFKKITVILVVYVVFLCGYYSVFKTQTFDWFYVVTLILSISISNIAQYLFGITNTLLLNADQKIYVVTILNIVTTVLNAICVFLCLTYSLSIQIVKLVSSLVFLIKPIVLVLYVKKNYEIDKHSKFDSSTLKNKWSGMVQHISTTLTNTIDYIVLTLFSTFGNLSIYNVYVLPINSFRLVIESFSTSFKSFFGKLIVEGKKKLLNVSFDFFEAIMHYVSTVVFGTIDYVLVPFVLFYTIGVSDLNYSDPVFSHLMCLAYFLFSLRIVYTTIIFSAGHFKETQHICIIEICINIVVSCALVFVFGISGVAIGTCISTLYRLIASVFYLRKNIVNRSITKFFVQIFVDFVTIVIFIFVDSLFEIRFDSFLFWFVDSMIVFAINLAIGTLVFLLFKWKIIVSFLKRGEEK